MTMLLFDLRLLVLLFVALCIAVLAPQIHVAPWYGDTMTAPEVVTVPNIIPRTDGHEAKHALEAISGGMILDAVQNRTCKTIEKYYSWMWNTYLVLCAFPNTSLVGGIIVGATTHKQITAYASSRAYWERVIYRDNYVGMAQ